MTRREQANIIFDEVDREYSIPSYMADDVICGIMWGRRDVYVQIIDGRG